MKRCVNALVALAAGLALLTGCSGRKVWDQPETLYSNATLTVTGVERLQDRTVFHLTAQGQKGSNFRIQPNTYIVGDDGRKYALQGSEGLVPGHWTPYPEEGTASFDLYFEPLRGCNRAIDLIEPNGWMVYGIHDAAHSLRIKPVRDEGQAIYDEMAFFQKGTGKLTGKFEGKHPEVIEFFGYNAFQEDNKKTGLVAPDGSFSLEITLDHPIYSYVRDDNSNDYYFFLSPDGETHMQIDSAGLIHYSSNSRYGALSEWMSEAGPRFYFPMQSITKEDWKTITISDYTSRIAEHYARMQELADYICRRQGFSDEEAHLLKQQIKINAAMDEMSAQFYLPRAKPGVPLDSLGQQRSIDLADASLYVSMAQLDPCDWTAFMLNNESFFLSNRYEYSSLLNSRDVPEMIRVDSILFHRAGPSIFLQAALMDRRMLSREVKGERTATHVWIGNDGTLQSKQVEYQKVWDERLATLTSPYLKARYQATLDELLAEQDDRYDLPAGEGTDIFNDLVAPFRGKWVYVEFWSTGCGPCRAGIEASVANRKKLSRQKDLEIVFITGDRSTPEKAYDDYAPKYLADEVSYRIPEAHYILLTTLFNFNGIPHVELVAPDGRIVRGKTLPGLASPDFLTELDMLRKER